ncbi:MAG TPA: DEAD/DEAH box helicase family protein [Candidatus Anaerobiospirillum stercoravium]|nr:DEAD/DEAH box helicase family protein [Candidatus Anaerobiospirillum stercoravium]
MTQTLNTTPTNVDPSVVEQVSSGAEVVDQNQALAEILKRFEDNTQTQRDKGTAFELLVLKVLSIAQPWCEQYERVQTYAEWAKEHPELTGGDARDTGVDLVATNKTQRLNQLNSGAGAGAAPSFTAIQCKFFRPNHYIPSSQVDSFTASLARVGTDGVTKLFSAGLFVYTGRLSEQVENLLLQCQTPIQTLGRSELEDANVDWVGYLKSGELSITHAVLRPYQQEALTAVLNGFQNNDRGQLIMACGTGKTFTALKIAEALTQNRGFVLYLVPSLALLNQTLLEWKRQSAVPFTALAVCSDRKVGKAGNDNDFAGFLRPSELLVPASTNGDKLVDKLIESYYEARLSRKPIAGMTVFFATYQSLGVIHEAMANCSFINFDLIICDEAHRTAGSYLNADKAADGSSESIFTRIHDNSYVSGTKRLYMTATPKVYGELAKAQEEAGEAVLYSMDDINKFGPVFYTLNFSKAISLGCLVDYKVLVLVCDQHLESKEEVMTYLSQSNAAKVVGTWKALNKFGLGEVLSDDPDPMRRAMGFAQIIDSKSQYDKVGSKQLAAHFQDVVDGYRAHLAAQNANVERASDEYAFVLEQDLVCDCRHIDGSMNAMQKSALLDWLRAEPEENHCKILFNVRCLSEGVNVSSLDCEVFFSPRKSQVEVVQIVGRVMRTAPGKVRGYVLIPVVVNAPDSPEAVLEQNRDFNVVVQVLNALKSINPDTPLVDPLLNKLDDRIEVIYTYRGELQPKKQPNAASSTNTAASGSNAGSHAGSNQAASTTGAQGVQGLLWQDQLAFEIEENVKAAIIKKLGRRKEWQDWADDVADICTAQVKAINQVLASGTNSKLKAEFARFCQALERSMCHHFEVDEVIEMLAQHIVIKPVLDALFHGFPFTEYNSIARTMTQMLEQLNAAGLTQTNVALGDFYDSVAQRMQNVTTLEDRQKVIIELFDRFFKKAFPKQQEKLGIVYTPIEVVDFINYSVNDLLQREFGTHLGSPQVEILDPFAGTGTFITRMMQCPDLIAPNELEHKYQHELHANELVPLAYYVAALNIEHVYHELLGKDAQSYQPNSIMVLKDTFADYEQPAVEQGQAEANLVAQAEQASAEGYFAANTELSRAQRALKFKVILGNPPYSVGQGSRNNDNQNERYPVLEQRMAQTYVAQADAVSNLKSLYDSYIKAFRWASDRLGSEGVIAFVTNAGWIDSAAAVGMRRCLQQEFSAVYIYHLKGNQRNTTGEQSRKEGGKIFGSGSRAPIAVTVLVKNPQAQEQGKIYFAAVDDYLSREQKLAQLRATHSILNAALQELKPDAYGDWLNQRRTDFAHFIACDGKKSSGVALFSNFSLGLATGRDAWSYSSSKDSLERNFAACIDLYNDQVDLYKADPVGFERENDESKIKWSRTLENMLRRGNKSSAFAKDAVLVASFRPYFKQFLYNDKHWLEMAYQMPQLFPRAEAGNLVISVSGVGVQEFSCLMSAQMPNLGYLSNTQCFPRYLYRKLETEGDASLLAAVDSAQGQVLLGYERVDAIAPEAVAHFKAAYPDDAAEIDADAVFYYIYGILHSTEYRATYASNLKKELPRIPRVARYEDFKAFETAGRALAQLHVGYEQVDPYSACTLSYAPNVTADTMDYRVDQLKYGKIKGKVGAAALDKSVIVYNHQLTISGIPLEVQDYVVNRKSALDWVVERARVTVDKASRIRNDFNDYAQAMGDERYILKLILQVITVSLETNQIVKNLPTLKIHPLDQ